MTRILIIDDDPIVTETYQKKFEGTYDMYFSKNGESGIKQAIAWQPSLIILDLILEGGESGLNVLSDLKSNQKTSHIPVLVISNLQYQKETVVTQGAVDYLVKTNTSIDEIGNKINEYISRSPVTQ